MRFEVLDIAEHTKEGGLADPLLRASSEHSIHLGLEPMNLECAMREHGGLAWPPSPRFVSRGAP